MLHYFYVGLGTAIGGTFRFWLSNYTYKILRESFPYGTLIVNRSKSETDKHYYKNQTLNFNTSSYI
jgi:hypothetical protein